MPTEQAKVPVPVTEPKEQLELKGFTPKVVSEMTDISISWAYRILAGEYMPGREVLAKIAEAVGMSMDELYHELEGRKAA